ncbi:MAG: tetratricopeptide repeat protein [Bacteroidia bacterium]|nr:tetratricopeptide repeat protein [Bacteroidia bacterium]
MSGTRFEQLIKLIEEEPNDSFLNHALAIEYFSLGKFEEAEKIFRKVIAENENYLGSYYQLGQTLEKLNKNEEAIKIYQKGIEIAKKLKNNKTLNELNEALWMLEE